MSLDWQWLAIFALALPLAVGHLYHFVLLINIGSGLGVPEPVMDRVRSALFLALFATTGLLLIGHVRDPWWNWAWPLKSYAILCLFSAIIVAPFCSLQLVFRRRPQGISGRSCLHDLARSGAARRPDRSGPHRWLLRLPGNEAFRLHLREWEVGFCEIPEPLDGLEIIQLTDFHLASCFDRKFFEAVVESCQGWDADLIVVTGDLIEEDSVVEWIEPLFGRLEARLGKFAILGNHDRDHDPDRIVSELKRAGFETARWRVDHD